MQLLKQMTKKKQLKKITAAAMGIKFITKLFDKDKKEGRFQQSAAM